MTLWLKRSCLALCSVATTIDSGAVSHLAQTFTWYVTSIPASGANVRVYKTVANGNDFF